MRYESFRGRANWLALEVFVGWPEIASRWLADTLDRVQNAGARHLWKHTTTESQTRATGSRYSQSGGGGA